MTQPPQPSRLAPPTPVRADRADRSRPTCRSTRWLPVRHASRPARPVDALPPPPDIGQPDLDDRAARRRPAPPAADGAGPSTGRDRLVPASPSRRPGSGPAGPSGPVGARRRRRPARRGAGAPPARCARRDARSPRRARLQLRHINPWTVFKFACALSIALFFIWLLTVAALYGILDATGVIGRINDAWTTVEGGDTIAADPAEHRAARRDRDRRGEHRAVHRAVDDRLDHLQPVRRHHRRHRGHAVRAGGLSRPADESGFGRARAAPGRLANRARGPVAQMVRAHP